MNNFQPDISPDRFFSCTVGYTYCPHGLLIQNFRNATGRTEFKTEFNVRSLLHAATVTTSSHYLQNMAPYFPSCSAWGVAVLLDYRRNFQILFKVSLLFFSSWPLVVSSFLYHTHTDGKYKLLEWPDRSCLLLYVSARIH